MCTGVSLVNLTQAAAVNGIKDVIYWSKISTTKSQYGEAMFNKIGQRTVFFSLKHVWRGTLSIALNHQVALVLHCTEMILADMIHDDTWHWVRWSPFICKLIEVVAPSLSSPHHCLFPFLRLLFWPALLLWTLPVNGSLCAPLLWAGQGQHPVLTCQGRISRALIRAK